jgi:ABC-type nitrate/sulfonate/bicarbonate transport system permease component
VTTLSSAEQTPSIGSVGVQAAVVPDGGASHKRVRRSRDAFGPTWRQRGIRYVAILVVLGAWQATGDVFHLRPIFLSTPSSVATAFYDLMANGQLEKAVGSSVYILALGIICSGLIGITIGTTLGRFKTLERALDPIVTFGNATPSIALLPLMEIWFGQGKLSAVIFIFIIGLWQMIVNTLAGMRVVRNGFRDVGTSFGMSRLEQTWRIYLPATQPFIFAGARISLAQCTVGMILAGQELGQGGLGGVANTYGTYFETDKLIAVIAMTCALALALFASLRVLQDVKFSWIKATSAGRRGGR